MNAINWGLLPTQNTNPGPPGCRPDDGDQHGGHRLARDGTFDCTAIRGYSACGPAFLDDDWWAHPGARDDAVAMQFLVPNWKFNPKMPCLVRP